MDDFLKGDSGAVYVFLYLLPGFLGLAVYDYLVEGQPRELFLSGALPHDMAWVTACSRLSQRAGKKRRIG